MVIHYLVSDFKSIQTLPWLLFHGRRRQLVFVAITVLGAMVPLYGIVTVINSWGVLLHPFTRPGGYESASLKGASMARRERQFSYYQAMTFPTPEITDPEDLRSHLSSCLALERIPKVDVRLSCQALPKKYKRSDFADRPLILSESRIKEVLGDKTIHGQPMYLNDLIPMVSLLPENYRARNFGIRLGDDTRNTSFPIVSKARKIGQTNVTLIPLNTRRHFGAILQELITNGDPIPYKDKLPVAFWRGTTTGEYQQEGRLAKWV